MLEIRLHGRGGQGAVTSSQVLAIAAFKDGKYSQAFPNFGVERTGAPVESYVRIDEKPVTLRQHVYDPDCIIVLDSSLIDAVDVTKGLQKNGMVIVNTDKSANDLKKLKGFKVYTINITKIALDVIGKPFVNIAALGAFCALSRQVSLKALDRAIDELFASRGKAAIAELNKKAAKAVYEAAK
ncbi:MAG: pyruvate ferredoxin oxidoreductase subunit gamma [Candidatus Diapherotrites archaeon]|uniref:pyruvate synthase n=1 Tax=Candidatus Iainarchaeum sp. TaxID=3101447 RepID=A0A938YST9_9ARCH|nr:pyruvate ferredoxin oxidoreductase subunit gamma [Candidatus Diapherotrites archaeon]